MYKLKDELKQKSQPQNDVDIDGDTMIVTAVTRPSGTGKGTFTKSGNTVVYKAGTKTGSDTLKYTISDGKGGTASANISITVK